MKILDYFRELPKIFDWYFLLPQIKRIQLNYIILLATVMSIAYYNDKRHRENYTILSTRIDAINNSRTQEQEKYTTKLVYYTDKFNHLLELLIQQREKRAELNTSNK
ncbi:hypothetical protein [Flavobacterium granuli]|uniref:Uncharacterized protein n=1 Tax=Flavobacterium granuli TaxID=280093 RepID=A0ABU1S0E9_9FLAO|nr:hypothetical protein [Flavobacterium granuli]MDR6844499.1 hypothetical protein [Flavobacterium granuli]